MDKDIVFFAYANSMNNPLKHLEEEYKEIDEILSTRSNNGDFIVRALPFATRESIIKNLIEYRKNIVVFQFSGHADSGTLLFDDSAADSKGIIQLLVQCPKLKLIILNGCSTQKQVNLILKKSFKKDPIIISTNAKIDDRSAYEYATAFWKAFNEEDTLVEEAHKIGIAAAQTIKNNNEINITRDAGFTELAENDIDKPLWDVSSNSKELIYRWKLSKKKTIPIGETNAVLKKELIYAFSNYDISLRNDLIDDVINENQVIIKILRSLPLPVSEQIRKLLARKSEKKSDHGHNFYGELNYHRLRQLTIAFQTIVETITFIHLAHFWNIDHKKNSKGLQDILTQVEEYFLLNVEKRKDYSLIKLCYSINEYFNSNDIVNFLEEWNSLSPPIEKDQTFNESINFITEIIKNIDLYEVNEIVDLCLEAEKHLAIIYSKLAFIIKYKMTSIQKINVKKLRHLPGSTCFNHNIVDLVSRYGDEDRVPQKDIDPSDDPKFGDTVILLNSKKDYLNLTPFIIDENSFNEKAHLAKICHFLLFERLENGKIKYAFTHVFNRADNYLEIKDEEEFKDIKDQLNNFKTSILKI